jgi:hypothetical protein
VVSPASRIARAAVCAGFAIASGGLVALATPAAALASEAYRDLLARHVRPGTVAGIRANLVDYAALARDPSYPVALADFAAADPTALASEADRIAFWINAYNLLAIKTIVDRRPIASIRDGGSFLFPIWKREVGRVAGRERSLDEVEHAILRKDFAEPRVHFAVVCASLSCPDLRPEPYEGARLEEQLGDQVKGFLANPTKGMRLPESGGTAEVSSIFKWFAEDFERGGGVAAFLRSNAPPDLKPRIGGLADDGLSYLDYDWSLNDAARAATGALRG